MKIKSERHINNIVQVYTTHEVLEKQNTCQVLDLLQLFQI